MDQLESWALSIRWLIGALVCLAIATLFILAICIGLRVWIFRGRQRRGEEELARRKVWPDGRSRPPVGDGMCDRCQQAFAQVYHLPSGRRLCPNCYETEISSAPSAGQGPGGGVDL